MFQDFLTEAPASPLRCGFWPQSLAPSTCLAPQVSGVGVGNDDVRVGTQPRTTVPVLRAIPRLPSSSTFLSRCRPWAFVVTVFACAVSYLTCATASEMGVLFIKQKTEAQSSLLQMQNLGWNLGHLSSHCAFRWSDDPLISICSTWELLGNAHTWVYSGPAGLEIEGLGDNLWLTSTVWFWGTQRRLSLSLFKGRERADVFLSPNSMPGTRVKAFSWICDVILTMPFYRWGNCSSNFPLSVMCKMTRAYTC